MMYILKYFIEQQLNLPNWGFTISKFKRDSYMYNNKIVNIC